MPSGLAECLYNIFTEFLNNFVFTWIGWSLNFNDLSILPFKELDSENAIVSEKLEAFFRLFFMFLLIKYSSAHIFYYLFLENKACFLFSNLENLNLFIKLH